MKQRFPFAEEDTASLIKCPGLCTSFSEVFKRSDLAFEDMGALERSNGLESRGPVVQELGSSLEPEGTPG